MSGFLEATHLSYEQLTQLEQTLDSLRVKDMLRAFMNVDAQYPGDERRISILTDSLFYHYAFCKERAFSARQTCTFMSIMQHIFRSDADSAASTAGDSHKAFEALLLKHAVQRPPLRCVCFLACRRSCARYLAQVLTALSPPTHTHTHTHTHYPTQHQGLQRGPSPQHRRPRQQRLLPPLPALQVHLRLPRGAAGAPSAAPSSRVRDSESARAGLGHLCAQGLMAVCLSLLRPATESVSPAPPHPTPLHSTSAVLLHTVDTTKTTFARSLFVLPSVCLSVCPAHTFYTFFRLPHTTLQLAPCCCCPLLPCTLCSPTQAKPHVFFYLFLLGLFTSRQLALSPVWVIEIIGNT